MNEAPKRENIWINLTLNVVLPSVLLSKGADWFGLSPAWILIIGLSFPLSYGIYDFITRNKTNLFSVIGFTSVLITGGVGLLKLPVEWIAVKEALIPALFGLAIYGSLYTKVPLVRTFLFSKELFDVPLIEAALEERQTQAPFEALMRVCTYWLVASFAVSSVLNYALAKYLVTSPSGSEAFNREMGKMTAWSWPVITIPSMIVMMVALTKLLNGIERCTGLKAEEVMHAAREDEARRQAKQKRD